MKKIITLIALALLIGTVAAIPDTYSILKGQQMIPYGGPWIADNQRTYWGTDKDASIRFNSTSSLLTISASTIKLEGAIWGTGVVGYNGSVVSDGIITGNTYVVGTFRTTGTTTVDKLINNGTYSGTAATLSGAMSSAGTAYAAKVISNDTISGTSATLSGALSSGGLASVANLKSNASGYFATTLNSGGTATLNAATINNTAAANALISSTIIKAGVNATTTINTTLASNNIKTVYGIDASGGNRSQTLPAASGTTGIELVVATSADPGENYAIVTATAGKLGGGGGATTLMTTSAAAGLTLVSDGTNYLIKGGYGTWI